MTAALCVGPPCLDPERAGRRPAVPGLRLCADCRRRLRSDLVELPALHSDCESALVPRRNPTGPRVTGSRGSTGIVLDDDALAARSAITELLASWSALVADERSVGRPARRDPRGLTAFLVTHFDWLLAHSAAGDFAEETSRTAAQARRLTCGAPALRLDLGECVLPDCGAAMTTAPPSRGGGGPRSFEVRCGAGHSWPPHQWLRLFQLQRADPGSRGN